MLMDSKDPLSPVPKCKFKEAKLCDDFVFENRDFDN